MQAAAVVMTLFLAAVAGAAAAFAEPAGQPWSDVECQDLRQGTTPESGAARLGEMLRLPDDEFRAAHRRFFGCLVPVTNPDDLLAPSKVRAPHSREERCAQLGAVLDRYNARLRASDRKLYHGWAAMDLWVRAANRARGSIHLPSGVFHLSNKIVKACTPARPEDAPRVAAAVRAGAALKVTVSVDPSLPWYMTAGRAYEDSAIKVEPSCRQGVAAGLEHGEAMLGPQHRHRALVDGTSTTFEIGPALYEESLLDGVSCTVVSLLESYCVNDVFVSCRLSLYVEKTITGAPHARVEESSGPCPFEWVEKSSSASAVHYHLRRRAGLRLDDKACRGNRVGTKPPVTV